MNSLIKFSKRCYSTCNSSGIINNELLNKFPKIELIQTNTYPIYRLKKEKEIEIPRIGCNPLKRLDKDLTRPIKQLLIIINNNNENNNTNDCLEYMTKISDLKLSVDINSVFLNNNNNNKENEKSLIRSIVNELPKIPILIGKDSNSSNKIIEFLETESNPIFPFVILNSPNKEINKLRNLSDIYLLLDNSNNNNINSNCSNSNIIEKVKGDNNSNNIKSFDILKNKFNEEM